MPRVATPPNVTFSSSEDWKSIALTSSLSAKSLEMVGLRIINPMLGSTLEAPAPHMYPIPFLALLGLQLLVLISASRLPEQQSVEEGHW